MRIAVMSRDMARRATYEEKAPLTAIISLTDSYSKPVRFRKKPWLRWVLQLQFDDVYREEDNCMTPDDAEKIHAFVLEVRDRAERLIVHCEYGISRSSGVAAAIMKSLYGEDRAIWENPLYNPNTHCYGLVLQAFGDRTP